MAGANRSWCQKVGQMSRVFQVQTPCRFEVEDLAKRIRRFIAGLAREHVSGYGRWGRFVRIKKS